MNPIGSIGSQDPYEKAFKRPSKDPKITKKKLYESLRIAPYIPFKGNIGSQEAHMNPIGRLNQAKKA